MKSFLIFLIVVIATIQCSIVQAQTAARDNRPFRTPTKHSIPQGSSVVGVFEGRPPCQEIAKQLKMEVSPECTKIKWRLTLFQDPVTHQPTTYQMLGNFPLPEGKWTTIKGTKSDPEAIIYHLNYDKPGISFYLLKGDDNVLFILDEQKEPRAGDFYLSYTLNRVDLFTQQ
jgi:hypothetical protein